jgi:molybdate transport system substrate-binding protein
VRRRALAVVLAAAAVLAGCGGDEQQAVRIEDEGGDERPLVVSAAASLQRPLRACSPGARLSFAGSDELAGQIRRGVRPDVFLAADTRLPEQLAREGLLRRPVVFATNELVIAARGEPPTLAALGEEGVTLAIGSDSVPVGAYTRAVLARLPAGQRRRILANVRSTEPDVRGIVGKLTQGAVTAGFVYATDARAARLRARRLPAALRPAVRYAGGVLREAPQPEVAARYVRTLTRGACAEALREAGFGAP